MEGDNLLQVGRVKELFNPVLPVNHKLWLDVIDQFTALGRKRLTKHRAVDIAAMTPADRSEARKQAAAALVRRMRAIVQRRHDIVHNVDRPKSALQGLSAGQAKAMTADIKDFVSLLDDHLDARRLW